jgi:hypothetical protein
MLSLRTIILSVIFLFGLTSLRILLVTRVATQGTLFDLRYMTPPLLPNSSDVASMIPEYSTINHCAASIIKEGDRSTLVIMLLFARFIEAIVNILTSNWILSVGFIQFVVFAAFRLYNFIYAPVEAAL